MTDAVPSGAPPTLRQLEYAVAIADEGHIGRAAAACAVSQPALSTQLQELERRLGLTLFERGRHGATVTPEGEPVIEQARKVLAAASDLVSVASDRSGDLVGPLSIGIIPTMAPYLLPAVVSEVRRRYPRAQAHLHEVRTDDLLVRLRDGRLDLGVLAGPLRGDDLEVASLARDPFLLALPEDHPLAGEGPLPTGVMAGLPMLLLEEGHCLRDQALEVCGNVGATSSSEIQATGLSALSQMVAAGLGVTLLPASAVDLEARPGTGLALRPLRDPSPDREVVLAWRHSSPRAPRYQALADALVKPVSKACRVS